MQNNLWLDEIKWDQNGLVPVIAQESHTGKVLTMAWMNRESLLMTVESGKAVYWSRSRNALWAKGETSGHVQRVMQISCDCDKDSLLLTVEQAGGIACHTGRHSCFYFRLVEKRWEAVEPVIKDPELIYKSNG